MSFLNFFSLSLQFSVLLGFIFMMQINIDFIGCVYDFVRFPSSPVAVVIVVVWLWSSGLWQVEEAGGL